MDALRDTLGAFLPDRPIHLAGSASGPLAGLTFAIKDVFDVEGHRTGGGNPDWLDSHAPAGATASAVQRLLGAGATLVGRTVTDELTFSLNGENHHYGTPVNPNAPGRIPGGSSSGSASAVAGGLVDFALGTDTGGSVRLPASNCGIFGIRPTHGRAPNDGVLPLAPSFDTVGWFARHAELLSRVGSVLLDSSSPPPGPRRLLVAADAFSLADDSVRPGLETAIRRIEASLGPADRVTLYPANAEPWLWSFRTLQGIEAWQAHGAWIRQQRPRFGRDIGERFEWAAGL
ncbi:MAG: amidase, partial [Gammaproteobacteria bacterium]|nr:amidase [Gammaproteobacteria bacterium]